MAATPSTMLPLGTPMPDFQLPNTLGGKAFDSKKLTGASGVLVMFICNHCPYVIHIRQELVRAAHEALSWGIQVVAINANSTRTHPQDGPDQMQALAVSEKWGFPYLFDETQKVAQAFQAACTPDFFLFDAQGELVYRGQFDESRPSNTKPIDGKDLRAALRAVRAGAPPSVEQRASVGCGIKWHPGHEPSYLQGGTALR